MVRIVTDTTCDIDLQKLREMDVEALPIPIHFGGDTYIHGVNIDNRRFYDMLRVAKTLPTTSQVPPAAFEEVFKKHTANGDEVVGIFISSKLSGTVQSANIARLAVGSDDVFVVDSLSTTMGLGLLVHIAVKMRDSGAKAAEIAREIERLSEKITIYAYVDTLKYLKLGGRLSAASAMVGNILNITPIIMLGNGMVESIGKTRGREAAFKRVGELFKNTISGEDYPISIGHVDEPGHIDSLLAEIGGGYTRENTLFCEIGGAICCHIGLGAAGVAFIAK